MGICCPCLDCLRKCRCMEPITSVKSEEGNWKTGCGGFLPRMRRRQTSDVYRSMVLEAKSSGSRCWQGPAPSKASRGGCSVPLPAFGSPRCSLPCGNITPVSASFFTLAVCSLCLCPNPHLPIRTPVTLD